MSILSHLKFSFDGNQNEMTNFLMLIKDSIETKMFPQTVVIATKVTADSMEMI